MRRSISRSVTLVEEFVATSTFAKWFNRQTANQDLSGEGYLRQSDCDGFFAIPVAPETYLGPDQDRKGFHVLSYEAIMDWFSRTEGLLERYAVKQKLLSTAIDKATLDCQPDEDLSVSKFWNS